MDFLKGLFKGKKTRSVEISLPKDFAQIFSGGHQGKYEPLFIIKDHPKVERLINEGRERATFLQREAEAIEERAEKNGKEMWAAIEDYMQDNGLWPKDMAFDSDPCFANKNGVIMLHVHEG
jgi:hypothetical protein